MELEYVESEYFWTWWNKGDEDIRIQIRADNVEEATEKLGRFLLDLKSQKVNFDKAGGEDPCQQSLLLNTST